MDAPGMSPFGGPLLASARARLAIAGAAILLLWIAVLWASLSEPTRKAALQNAAPEVHALRLVVASGQAAPGGGSFNRFDVSSQPIVAPVNGRGQIAFYASVARAKATEGIFLATASRITKAAAVGDAVPGGGVLSEFARHPLPALNDAGKIAFGASVAGARATEGIFLAADDRLKAIALSGADAPGVQNGTFVEFDAPVINNRGVVAFPAVLERGAVLGGIFLAGTRDLHLLVGAGEIGPGGMMLVRFSERVAIDDQDNVAFVAHLGSGTSSEAVLVANASGLTQLAIVGESAPGGGRFAAFGPWPNFGPNASVAFVAGVDDGPGTLGIYVGTRGALRRVTMVGDRLANGGAVPAFALNSVTSVGSRGGLTFATMANPESGQNGIYYYGPPGS